jgi:hypothetical protein
MQHHATPCDTMRHHATPCTSLPRTQGEGASDTAEGMQPSATRCGVVNSPHRTSAHAGTAGAGATDWPARPVASHGARGPPRPSSVRASSVQGAHRQDLSLSASTSAPLTCRGQIGTPTGANSSGSDPLSKLLPHGLRASLPGLLQATCLSPTMGGGQAGGGGVGIGGLRPGLPALGADLASSGPKKRHSVMASRR